MCFSATANFTGSAVLGAIGVATIAEVKHRRELLFASLPCLFALHQFTEGFVWLGINGKISQTALQGVAAAYVLYAQGLLPFLLPLSVFLIEPTRRQRRRMMYFLGLGQCSDPLYPMGPDNGSAAGLRRRAQHRVQQSTHDQQTCGRPLCHRYLWRIVLLRL